MSDAEVTRTILDALHARHKRERNGTSRAWIYAEEVRVSTGFSYVPQEGIDDAIRLGSEQRIDAFALHTWPSQKWRRVAYEVKASLTDLRRELEKPYKCEAALALSNEYYLVAPTEILTGGITDDFPETWGVMAYHPSGLRTIRKAPWRNTPLPPYSFLMSVARNLQQSLEAAQLEQASA